MNNPAIEFVLTLPEQGQKWEYAVSHKGVLIASSDGDARFDSVALALKAAVADVNQKLVDRRGGA
ncbi:MAG: hypothetical protein RIR18_1278 [Pseudomonadota bacterium]|jgi:hypothetical protein